MTDTDSDTETDTDSDSDSDSGSDTDTDTDSNTDSETDTDSDSDSDTNSDTDTDSDTDSDSDADTTNLAPEFDDPDDPDVYDLPFLYGDERGVVGHGGDVGTFNASDPNSDALTFSVLGDIPLPYELVATGNSATLRLIPGARAVGGTFSIQVQVADNGSPALTDVATVNWTVTGTGIGTCDAVDDSYTVTGNSVSPASYLFMILQNDVDSNGGSPNRLKVSGLTVPQHGTVRSVGGTHVVYTPNAGYTGEDWFLYQVEDNATLGRDWARVSVTVNPNVAPDLPADLAFFHRINTSYVGSVPELAGDTDPLIWSITPGTPFKINQSGSISVDSAAPPIIPGATYSVTVTASDGEFSDSCTVTIRVSKAPVIENDFHHVYIDLPRTFNVGDIITTVPYEQVDPEDNGPGGVSYYTSNQLVFDAVAGAAGGVDIVRSWTAVNAAALDGTSITLTVYDKDGDDTVTIHFHAKDYLPPAFSDNTYSFAVVSENTDGNVIGYVQATDPQGLALSYTVPPALEGKIEIAFGAVMLVDAADVLSLISTSGGSSGGHQITVTNLAGLSDTATLTLNAANPTVLNNQVQDYINTWESRALTRSDNIKDEAVTVINNNFSDLKAKVVNEATSRIDMADLFFAFADFVPSPLAAGLSDIGQAVLQMVVHAKEENESAALSVQQAAAVAKAGKLNVQEEGKIVQAAADKRNAWNNFLATNPTQLKMQEWFTDLQAEWPLP